ncbi:MAG TPA: hypothetical protein EYQ09_01670 [Flavobacteriales bacterium]|jgi:hypothetical protein|nr:hypothetical protein [Flavobacteriales bacterium]HIK62476.1 hypothetical protein [Flavobacteriales bacterium]
MKKLLLILLFFPLFFTSSCEKESNSINSCPDLIQNVNLGDFPMYFYGVNEIVLDENELFVNVNYGGGEWSSSIDGSTGFFEGYNYNQ